MFTTFALAGLAPAAPPKFISVNPRQVNSVVADSRGGALLNIQGHDMNVWVKEEPELVARMLNVALRELYGCDR